MLPGFRPCLNGASASKPAQNFDIHKNDPKLFINSSEVIIFHIQNDHFEANISAASNEEQPHFSELIFAPANRFAPLPGTSKFRSPIQSPVSADRIIVPLPEISAPSGTAKRVSKIQRRFSRKKLRLFNFFQPKRAEYESSRGSPYPKRSLLVSPTSQSTQTTGVRSFTSSSTQTYTSAYTIRSSSSGKSSGILSSLIARIFGKKPKNPLLPSPNRTDPPPQNQSRFQFDFWPFKR